MQIHSLRFPHPIFHSPLENEMNKQHGTAKMFANNSILLEDNVSVMSFHNKINDKNAYVKSQKCANGLILKSVLY